jgi:microcystin-dependent protein
MAHDDLTDPEIHEPKGVANAPANSVYIADGNGSGAWASLPSVNPALISTPLGAVSDFAGTVAPSKWVLCYGQAISRATYANLFSVIGTTYGSGDGSTTFNVPDCRGRATAGKSNMGGSDNGLLTGGTVLGAKFGAQTVTLVAANLPTLTGSAASAGSHTHSVTNDDDVSNTAGGTLTQVADSGAAAYSTYTLETSTSSNHSHTVTVNSGGNDPHNNMQPSLVVNKIMYHGVA